MKKTKMMMAALLCCAMATTVFTSCGGDDGGNSTPNIPKIVGFQVDYSLNIPEKITYGEEIYGNYYLLCDKIEVGYIDENGTEQKESVIDGKWSKSVTYKTSLDGYVKLYLTKPASIDEESLPYDKYRSYVDLKPYSVADVTFFYSDGTKVKGVMSNFNIGTSSSPLSFAKSKAQMYFDKYIEDEVYIMSIKYQF